MNESNGGAYEKTACKETTGDTSLLRLIRAYTYTPFITGRALTEQRTNHVPVARGTFRYKTVLRVRGKKEGEKATARDRDYFRSYHELR